jgi:N-acetylneuraminic acid mutarotase
MATTTINNYLYSIGVYTNNHSVFSNNICRLNISEQKEWQNVKIIGSLKPAYGRSCIPIDQSTILIFGGYNGNENLNESLIMKVQKEDEHILEESGKLTTNAYFYQSSSPVFQEGKIFAFDYFSVLHIYDQNKWRGKSKQEWSTV